MTEFQVITKAVNEMIDNPTIKYLAKESPRTIKWIYEYADLKAEREETYFHCMPASYIISHAERMAKVIHYLGKYSKYVKQSLIDNGF